jgi:hypothetical protein
VILVGNVFFVFHAVLPTPELLIVVLLLLLMFFDLFFRGIRLERWQDVQLVLAGNGYLVFFN